MDLDSAIFYTHNLPAITKFYTQTLNLKLEYSVPNKYVSFIFPSGARLGIKQSAEPRELPGHQTIELAIENVQELYTKIKSQHLHIYRELSQKPWGLEFSIFDPDQNKVIFLQRTK